MRFFYTSNISGDFSDGVTKIQFKKAEFTNSGWSGIAALESESDIKCAEYLVANRGIVCEIPQSHYESLAALAGLEVTWLQGLKKTDSIPVNMEDYIQPDISAGRFKVKKPTEDIQLEVDNVASPKVQRKGRK